MNLRVRALLVLILVALSLTVSVASEVPNSASPSLRAINTFRVAQVNQERQEVVAESLKGNDKNDSEESNGGQSHGSKNDSSEFHDSPWMPFSVIAGCILVAGVAFVSVQRYRRTRLEKMLSSLSPSAPAATDTIPRPTAPVVVVVPPHEPKKNTDVMPGPEQSRPKDYIDTEPAHVDHSTANPAMHYVEEAPPSYFDIAEHEANNPNSGRQEWMLETVSVPKPPVDIEYKRY